MRSFRESDPRLPSETRGTHRRPCLEQTVKRVFSPDKSEPKQECGWAVGSKQMGGQWRVASLLTYLKAAPLRAISYRNFMPLKEYFGGRPHGIEIL